MAAPLGPNGKPHVSPTSGELPKCTDACSQNISAAASEAINELSQVAPASSSVLKASQTGNGSEAERIESAVDYFSKIIKAVKQQHIYSSFSPSEIALLRSVSRQENATVMHSHQFSIEIAQLLDNLSQKVINSNDSFALVQLIELQIDLEGVKKFIPLAMKFGDPNLKKYVLESIAKKQASFRDIEGAKETTALIKDEHRKNIILNAILLVEIEIKDFEKAKETVKKMYDKNSFNESDALSKIAIAQAKIQDFEGAIQTNYLIDPQFLSLIDENLMGIILEQAKAKDYEGAKVTANKLDFLKKGDAYAKIAEEQIIHHDYEAAELTMSQESVDKLKLFSLMAKEQLHTQNLKEAQQTFILAKEVAYQLPFNLDVLFQFSKLQINLNDFEGAKNSLIIAKENIQRINDSSKESLLIKVATLQIDCEDWKEANLTLDLIKAFFCKDERVSNYNSSKHLKNVAVLQASAQNIIGAKETVNFIQFPTQKGKALIEIARIQAKNGDVLGAKQTVELIEDFSERDTAFEKIALEQAKSHDHLGAIETINLMRSSYDKNLASESVARTQIELGFFEATLLIANQMTDVKRKNLILQRLAIKQAQTGAFENAKITTQKINDLSMKTHTLIEIASMQIKSLDFSAARQTLAIAKAIEDDDYPERLKSLALIIKQEVKFNKSDALATFKLLKTLVTSEELVPSLIDPFLNLIKELHAVIY